MVFTPVMLYRFYRLKITGNPPVNRIRPAPSRLDQDSSPRRESWHQDQISWRSITNKHGLMGEEMDILDIHIYNIIKYNILYHNILQNIYIHNKIYNIIYNIY